jgi:hypothetical protein
MGELLQMEGQGRGRDIELVGDHAGGQPIRTALHQKPENGEPCFMRKGAEPGDDLIRLHRHTSDISTNIEITEASRACQR